MIGTKIENYRITSVLGEGGMGVVYKAFDLKLERYVALKILNQKAVSNPQFVERFKREAKNQAQLSHPNIVPVYGFADDQNMLGFVMEYVNGETLEERIEKNGSLGFIEALEVMKQILAGAAFAHSKGFIHRDLKPSNVIFTQDGIAKIMDFGISKSVNESKGITKSGVKIGTLLYMSPEQLKAYEPTTQSDIYALGIIFYEILLGKNPFDGNSDFEIMEAHLKKYPPRISSLIPEIPEEIDRIIFKAISKSTEKRYKDAIEFYNDIDQELVRLKSEQRKTHEFLVKKELTREIRVKATNYLMIAGGVLFAAVIIYFAYNYLSEFFIRSDDRGAFQIGTGNDAAELFFPASGWNKIDIPLSESLSGIKFSGNTGVICGFNGSLLLSTDGGRSWTRINTGTNENFYSVNDLGGKIFLITGEKGSIYKYNSADNSLRKILSPATESLFDSYYDKSSNTGYLCGGEGTILKTSDGGESWFKQNSGSVKLLYALVFKNPEEGFAAGWDGELLSTSNGGKTWSRHTGLTNNYLKDIVFLNEVVGIMVGGEGEIFKTYDGGISWSRKNSGSNSGLHFVKFIDNKNGFVLGSNGEILISTDGGDKWYLSNSGSNVLLTGASISSDNSLYVTGHNGTVLVSR